MKKHFYSLAAALCVCLLFAAAAKAQDAAKVAGTWEISSQGPQGTMTQTLTLQQDGAKLTGTIKGQRGDQPVEGSVDGNKVSFTAKISTPNGDISIPYTGTVTGDSMSGTRRGRNGDVPWTAKRTQ